MIRSFSLATLLVLALGFANHAPAQVTLKHNFPDGRTSTLEAVVKTAQTLNLAGKEIVTGSEQELTIAATNGQRAADGMLVVTNKITALKAELTLPGDTKLSFDSAKPDADPPGTQFDSLLDVFKATAKSTWEAVMNQENRVVTIKGRDAAYADLSETVRDAMKAQLDPEYLKTAANDELNKLPSQPVSPGDSWERTNTVRLDSGQRLTFTIKYTYEGSVQQGAKKLEKISSQVTKVDYTAEAGSPLKVVEADLKVAESTGELLFDPAYGQFASQQSKVQVKGTLKLEVAGMEFAGDLDLTMENSSKLK